MYVRQLMCVYVCSSDSAGGSAGEKEEKDGLLHCQLQAPEPQAQASPQLHRGDGRVSRVLLSLPLHVLQHHVPRQGVPHHHSQQQLLRPLLK